MSPERWQLVQFANRMDATSFVYVGAVVCCCADAVDTLRIVPATISAAENEVRIIIRLRYFCGEADVDGAGRKLNVMLVYIISSHV